MGVTWGRETPVGTHAAQVSGGGRNRSRQPFAGAAGTPEPTASWWLRRPPHRQVHLGAGSPGSPSAHPHPRRCLFPAGFCLKVLQLSGSGWANPPAPHGCSRLSAPLGKGRSCSCTQNGIRGVGTALKSPWKLYPRMQKPVMPAAAWPAVLGLAQRSLRTLLLLGFGRTPQKNPKNWFGFSKGDQTPTEVGRGGDQGATGHGRP